MRALLALLFLMSLVSALDIQLLLDGEPVEDKIILREGRHSIAYRISSSTYPVHFLRYEVNIRPPNLEVIAERLRIPLRAKIDATLNESLSGAFVVDIPELTCGKYFVEAHVFYDSGSGEEMWSREVEIDIPCNDIRERIVYLLLAFTPRGIFSRLVHLFGFMW